MHQDCIFCKIVSKEIPAYVVYEDDTSLGFLDINPISPGHTLVIPKQHTPDFYNLEDSTYLHIQSVAKKIAHRLKIKTESKRIGMMIAGWEVPHTHIHIVPMNDIYDITSKSILNNSLLQPTSAELQAILKLIGPIK